MSSHGSDSGLIEGLETLNRPNGHAAANQDNSFSHHFGPFEGRHGATCPGREKVCQLAGGRWQGFNRTTIPQFFDPGGIVADHDSGGAQLSQRNEPGNMRRAVAPRIDGGDGIGRTGRRVRPARSVEAGSEKVGEGRPARWGVPFRGLPDTGFANYVDGVGTLASQRGQLGCCPCSAWGFCAGVITL